MGATAAVIGAGTMGAGIAYTFAIAGFDTTVVETSAQRVELVGAQLRGVADNGISRGKLSQESASAALARLAFVETPDDIPLHRDIIVETVPERLDLKREILQAAERRRPAILSTNTSALSVDELASFVTDPTTFLGTHFFNPVWSIGLVELIRGAATSTETVEAARAIAVRLGKETAVVRDAPGFATSRLDLVAGLEAMRMVQDGVASAEDIDRAMRVAYRHPVGPLRLSDIVGLDVRLDIARNLAKELGPGFEPPQILIDMVERGELGEKSGRGFYAWP
jgi:3-hydroxybutyryl-CoA dehydrogenase